MILTERDRKFIYFIENTNLIFTNQQIADIFYPAGNPKSSYMIANKRLRKMIQGKYIKKISGKFGERDIYYCDKKPKTFEHKLTMSEFLAKMSTNGFKIIDVDIEYKGFEEEYHLRPDMRIITEYYNEKYVIIVEVDITKEFSNMDKYNRLVDNIRKGQHRDCVPYPFLIVSVCNRKPQVTGSCNPLHIRKDLSDFSKFVWAFAKK